MKTKSITGLTAAILLGTVLSAFAESTERGGERGRPRAQGNTTEETAEGRTQEDGGDRGSDPSTHASNNPRSAADILGMDILSTDDEKIGEVEDIIIDMESGQILAVVVATGGFLDLDGHPRQISPKDLRFDSDRENLLTDLSKEEIQSAPRFSSDDIPSLERVPPIGGEQGEATNSGAQERADHRDVSRETRTVHAGGPLLSISESGGSQARDGEDNGQEEESRDDRTEERSAISGKNLAVSGLLDMKLETSQGESVGAVETVYIDLEKGEALGVVVSTGGFLGMGDRKTLLGLNELEYNTDEKILIVDLNKERLGEVPAYNENEPGAFDTLRKRLEQSGFSFPGL